MKKTHILFILCAGLQHLGGQQAQGIENDGAVDNFLDSILTTHQHSAPAAPPTWAQAASYDETAGMGDMKAQRWMGWRYRQARGVSQNEHLARTYFNMAAEHGHADIVKLLLNSGANKNMQDSTGKRAIDYADKAEVISILTN